MRPRGRSRPSDASVNRSSSPQACRETELAQKLQNEQFALLQCAVVEAEGIILDAVAKLDDPIHVRCTSSPGKDAPHNKHHSMKTLPLVIVQWFNLLYLYNVFSLKSNFKN